MKRFLIVDDDMLSRTILQTFFSTFASCDAAADGKEGFDLFIKSILDGKPYDLVCTDLVMPVLDGYGLITKIREAEQALPVKDCIRTTIFVLSSSGSTEDMAHALLECDSDDYIVKPLHREQAAAMLKKYHLLENDYNIP